MPNGAPPHPATAGSPIQQRDRVATWSPGLSIVRLNAIAEETPFLVCDLDTIERRYEELTELLPGLAVFFAMKSNSAGTILRTVHHLGRSLEVASATEMRIAPAAAA